MAGPYLHTWLDPADVTAWLTSNGQPGYPADQVETVCAQTEAYVQRCRPDRFVPVPDDPDAAPVYTPDGEVYQGAKMYAARQLRRRQSPTGSEPYATSGQTFVARYDTEIERALRTGASTVPGVG